MVRCRTIRCARMVTTDQGESRFQDWFVRLQCRPVVPLHPLRGPSWARPRLPCSNSTACAHRRLPVQPLRQRRRLSSRCPAYDGLEQPGRRDGVTPIAAAAIKVGSTRCWRAATTLRARRCALLQGWVDGFVPMPGPASPRHRRTGIGTVYRYHDAKRRDKQRLAAEYSICGRTRHLQAHS